MCIGDPDDPSPDVQPARHGRERAPRPPDHVDHPPLRGGRRRPLRPRPHARHHAPVHRPGGLGHRRLHGPVLRRRHHLDPPGARPLHRQGRRPDPDDGRAPRQGDRLLPRPRRLDAPRRRGHRQPRRQRDRRRRHPDRGRRGTRLPPARRGPRGRLLLRGRRDQRGRLPRGRQPRRHLEAAGGLHLREQQYGMSFTEKSMAGRERRRPRPPTASPASRSTATT